MTDSEKILEKTIERARERDIIIPTYEQMRDPSKIPENVREELGGIGLWDLHPRNLFRISWKNDPRTGGFDGVNYVELPSELTGVKARIFVLLGKFFPTGSHKVGATFGPLVSRLVTGAFDPTKQKALWPSTGNYCRGGAYNSYLLGCPSIAVLPEGMSRERFEWLRKLGAEIYPTPGVESNVKEVFDKTKELKNERPEEIVVLNQFEEFENPMWHYAVTGPAIEDVYLKEKRAGQRFTALFLTQGSGGTLGSGNYLRERFPQVKVCAGEALQCPTLLYNGFGAHRIEGIGDKHVPWILDARNLDMVAGIDDEACMHIVRLFNTQEGRDLLADRGVPSEIVGKLDLLGISSIANILGAIKMAKYYEMDEDDMVFTVATDSMELYQSRLKELGSGYTEIQAACDFERYLKAATTDFMAELSYLDRKRIHNLKYFTWVEQQGRSVEELNEQWHDREHWRKKLDGYKRADELIREFNRRVGL